MDRRQQKTKIAIHQAMTTLLKKKKIEALTVQDIIDEANIGRSTFYSHFETKEELLEEICREMFAHVFSKDLAPEKATIFQKDARALQTALHIFYITCRIIRKTSRQSCTAKQKSFLPHIFAITLNRLFMMIWWPIPKCQKHLPCNF